MPHIVNAAEITGEEDIQEAQIEEILRNEGLPRDADELALMFIRAVERCPWAFCGDKWRTPFRMFVTKLAALNTPHDETVCGVHCRLVQGVYSVMRDRIASIH